MQSRFPINSAATQVAFSKNGHWIGVATNTLQIWNLASSPSLSAEWPTPHKITSLAFSNSGNHMVVSNEQEKATLYRWSDDRWSAVPHLQDIPHNPSRRRRACIHGSRSNTRYRFRRSKNSSMANIESGEDLTPGTPADGSRSNIARICVSADGTWLAAATLTGCDVWSCYWQAPLAPPSQPID